MKGRWEYNIIVWFIFMYSQKWNCPNSYQETGTGVPYKIKWLKTKWHKDRWTGRFTNSLYFRQWVADSFTFERIGLHGPWVSLYVVVQDGRELFIPAPALVHFLHPIRRSPEVCSTNSLCPYFLCQQQRVPASRNKCPKLSKFLLLEI